MPNVDGASHSNQSFGEYAQNVFSNVKKASVYIPGVSSLNLIANAVNSAKNNKPLTKSKSFHRSVAAFVPVLGNIALGVHDVSKYVEAQKAKGKHPESQNTTASVSSKSIRESASDLEKPKTEETGKPITPSTPSSPGQIKIIRRPVNLKPEVVATPTKEDVNEVGVEKQTNEKENEIAGKLKQNLSDQIKEIGKTEASFKNTAATFNVRLGLFRNSIDSNTKAGEFISSYKDALTKSLQEMKPFQDKIDSIMNNNNLDSMQKLEQLNKAYSSDEFKQYASTLNEMSLLHQSFDEFAKAPLNAQGQTLNALFKRFKEPAESMAAEFTQRFPRHDMFLSGFQKDVNGAVEKQLKTQTTSEFSSTKADIEETIKNFKEIGKIFNK